MPSSHSDPHDRDTRADPSRQDPAADDSGPTGTLRDSTGRGGGKRRRTAGYGPPQPGETFAGFTIGEQIGRGAMGLVFRARDAAGRDIALKVILAHQADEDGVARFVREGQAMAAIPAHPNVVRVLSAGKERGLPWLAMDFVEGVTLKDKIRQGPLPIEEARLIAHRLAEALVHIHGSGVVHRDLKPANVMLRAEDGEPLLTDFGLARIQGAQRLTLSGDVIGTPVYMSPEQVLGLKQEIDAQTDVWALGVLLYEMLAGQPPFLGANLTQMAQLITTTEPRPIRSVRGEVDRDLANAIDSALVKPKEHRLPDAASFVAALDAVPDRHDSARQSRSRTASFTSGTSLPRARKRAIRAGLILGLVGGLVVGAGLFVRSRMRGVNVEALQKELSQLDREATKGLPGLLGKSTTETEVARFAEALAALRTKSEAAGAPIDLSRIEAAVLRGQLELALNQRDWKAAAAAVEQTPSPNELTILQARVALLQDGEVDQAALVALIDDSQPELAIAARVLLARTRSRTDPAKALELLKARVPPLLAEAEGRRAKLLIAIDQANSDEVGKLAPRVPAPARKIAWRRALRAVQTRGAGANPKHEPLRQALRVLAHLATDADADLQEAEGPAVAVAVLRRVVSLETELLKKLRHSARGRRSVAISKVVRLFTALADSGLRPPWPDRTDVKSKSKRMLYKDLTNQLLYMQRQDMTGAQAAQVLRAFVQLDIPVSGTAFSPVKNEDLAALPDGPYKTYLQQQVHLYVFKNRSVDPRKRLHELLPQRTVFGNHHRALLLASASSWSELDPTRQLAMARQAVHLDPTCSQAQVAFLVGLARSNAKDELLPALGRMEERLTNSSSDLDVRERRATALAYAYQGDGQQVERWLSTISSGPQSLLSENWVKSVKLEIRRVLRDVRRGKKKQD